MIENLDARTNWDACLMVINSVARAPQTPEGTHHISASLMRSFDTNYRGRTVALSQMARVSPDPVACSAAINRIHRLFGIKAEFTESRAAEVVLAFAINGLGNIELLTEGYSIQTEEPFKRRSSLYTSYSNPPQIHNPESVDLLEEYLAAHPEVQERVSEKVRARAAQISLKSKLHQHHVVTKHLRGY